MPCVSDADSNRVDTFRDIFGSSLAKSQRKKSKMLFGWVFCFFVTSCAINETSLSNTPKQIEIRKADWETLYPTNISCLDFEDLASKQYVIKDSDIILDITNELKKLKPKEVVPLDVRCKLFVYSNDTLLSSYCIGKKTTYSDGLYYHTSNRLVELIESDKLTPVKDIPTGKKEFCNWEKDKKRFYHYLEEQSHRLYNETNDSIVLRIKICIDSSGKCHETTIKQIYGENTMRILREIEEMIKEEFRWTPCPDRTIDDWQVLTIVIQ